MNHQWTKITKSDDKVLVEIMFGTDSDPEQSDEILLIRGHVEIEGRPSVEEYALEALQSLRTVLGDEIQRLKRI